MPPEPDWLAKARAEGRILTDTRVSGLMEQEVPQAEKPRKYRNTVVEWEVDGRLTRFHSKKELARWLMLAELQKLGAIRKLERQVKFDLIVNDVKITAYWADHVYEESVDGEAWYRVVEDVKGVRTPEYRLKRNLMLALFGIKIREV